MGEIAWSKKICGEIVDAGGKVYVLPGVAQSSGLPDRLIVTTLGEWLVEFKGVNTPLKTNQKLTLQDISARQPGFAFLVRQPCNIFWGFDPLGVDVTPHFFDGTGLGLIHGLSLLKTYAEQLKERGLSVKDQIIKENTAGN